MVRVRFRRLISRKHTGFAGTDSPPKEKMGNLESSSRSHERCSTSVVEQLDQQHSHEAKGKSSPTLGSASPQTKPTCSVIDAPTSEELRKELDLARPEHSNQSWEESLFSLSQQSDVSSDDDALSCNVCSESSTQLAVFSPVPPASSDWSNSDRVSSGEDDNGEHCDDDIDNEEGYLFLGSCGGVTMLGVADSLDAATIATSSRRSIADTHSMCSAIESATKWTFP